MLLNHCKQDILNFRSHPCSFWETSLLLTFFPAEEDEGGSEPCSPYIVIVRNLYYVMTLVDI